MTDPNRIDPLAPPFDRRAPVPSVTGTPVIPPRALPWLTFLAAAAVAGLEAAGQSFTGPAAVACHFIALALSTVAGAASPGWRK